MSNILGEFMLEKLRPFLDWKLFFQQRRQILDDVHFIESEANRQQLASPLKFASQALSIVAVVLLVTGFAYDKFYSSFYSRFVSEAQHEFLKQHKEFRMKLDEAKTLDDLRQIKQLDKKREEMFVMAEDLKRQMQGASHYLSIKSRLNSFFVPLSIVAASLFFSLIFKRGAGEITTRDHTRAAYIYVTVSLYFWPMVVYSPALLLQSYNQVYFETGMGELAFYRLADLIGWIAVGLLVICAIWSIIIMNDISSRLSYNLQRSECSIFPVHFISNLIMLPIIYIVFVAIVSYWPM